MPTYTQIALLVLAVCVILKLDVYNPYSEYVHIHNIAIMILIAQHAFCVMRSISIQSGLQQFIMWATFNLAWGNIPMYGYTRMEQWFLYCFWIVVVVNYTLHVDRLFGQHMSVLSLAMLKASSVLAFSIVWFTKVCNVRFVSEPVQNVYNPTVEYQADEYPDTIAITHDDDDMEHLHSSMGACVIANPVTDDNEYPLTAANVLGGSRRITTLKYGYYKIKTRCCYDAGQPIVLDKEFVEVRRQVIRTFFSTNNIIEIPIAPAVYEYAGIDFDTSSSENDYQSLGIDTDDDYLPSAGESKFESTSPQSPNVEFQADEYSDMIPDRQWEKADRKSQRALEKEKLNHKKVVEKLKAAKAEEHKIKFHSMEELSLDDCPEFRSLAESFRSISSPSTASDTSLFSAKFHNPTFKKVEKVCLLIANITQCNTISHVMTTLSAYLAGEFETSVTHVLYSYITELFDAPTGGEVVGQAAVEMMSYFKNLTTLWSEIKGSDFFGKIQKAIACVLTWSVAKGANIKMDRATFDYFYESSAMRAIRSADIWMQIVDCGVFVWEKLHLYLQNGDIHSIFANIPEAHAYEKQYALIVGRYSAYENGKEKVLSMQAQEYLGTIVALIEKTETYLQSAHGAEKSVLTSKLKKLRELETGVLESLEVITSRERPVTFLFHGDSGVGKTTMMPEILNILMRANNMDPSREYIVNLNPNDKYQSEIKSTHTVYVLDDIANTSPDFLQSSPLQILNDAINNNPRYALKADVSSKGKVLLMPKILVGTTNIKSLNAGTFSICPESVMSRWDAVIHVSVRPEFREEGTMRIDRSRIPDDDTVIPDLWLFTVERTLSIKHEDPTRPNGYAFYVVRHQGVPLQDVGIGQLIQYLVATSNDVILHQQRVVQKMGISHSRELCPHRSHVSICPTCIAEVVPGLEAQALTTGDLVSRITNYAVATYTHTPRWLMFFVGAVPLSVGSLLRYGFVLTLFFKWRQFERMVYEVLFKSTLLATLIVIVPWYFLDMTWLGALSLFLVCAACIFVFGMKLHIHSLQRHLHRVPMHYISTRRREIKWLKVASASSAAIALVYFLQKAMRMHRKVVGHGAEFAIPEKDEVPRENIWKKVYVTPPSVATNLKTATPDQIYPLIRRDLGFATFERKNEDGLTMKMDCNLMPMQSNVWLMPYHVAAKKQTYVTVYRGDPNALGTSFSCKLSENMFERVANTDLCMLYLPSGGSQRDFTHLLPQGPTERNVAGHFIYRQKDGEIFECDLAMTPHVLVMPGDDQTYLSMKYNTPIATRLGMCMSPIFNKGKHTYIVGFHIAGVTGTPEGYAAQLCYQQACAAIDRLFQKCKISFQAASDNGMQLEFPAYGVALTGGLHDKSALKFQEDGRVRTYGSHTGRRVTYRSRVGLTQISQTVEEVFGVPNRHGPPMNMSSWKPWQRITSQWTHTKQLNPDLLELAAQDFERHIITGLEQCSEKERKRVHPVPLVVALSGVDEVYGVDSMNLASSCGFPINKPKSEIVFEMEDAIEGITRPLDVPQEVKDEVAEAEERLARGERVWFINKAALKDEATKIGKEKVRVFTCTQMAFLILLRMYFITICKFIMEHWSLFETAVGVNAMSAEWTQLTQVMLKFDNIMAGDYIDFDNQMEAMETLCGSRIFLVVAKWGGYDERQLTIMRGLCTEICYSLIEVNGEYDEFYGIQPSGHGLTVFLNGFVASIRGRYGYYHAYGGDPPGPYAAHVSVITYGDDTKGSVSMCAEKYNHVSHHAAMKECGIGYTMADKTAEIVPYVTNEESDFLKRSSVWSDEFKQYMAPLQEASIYKALHCCVESKILSPEEHAAEVIRGANHEWFYHGKETFEDRHAKLLIVVDRHNLRAFLPEGVLPGYNELKKAYVDRLPKL